MKKNLFIALCALPLLLMAESMPSDYYNKADGKKDAELKAWLRECIRTHTVIEYGTPTWEVFYYSDRDDEGYCMDMYCDTWQKFTTPGAVVSGCNIEHSFAKSWWGGAKYDQYKDCYHLNPSNSSANSARSNYPPGIPEKEIKTSGSMKVGKRHHDGLNMDHSVFEPKDEYKGDFARAYFYMATCYGRDLNNEQPDLPANGKKNYVGWRIDNNDVGSKFAMQNDNYLEFQDWLIDLLLAWHRQDPVSEKELKRMDAVSDYQHNRNPFIEYPCLAEYIWGKRKGQTASFATLKNTYDADYLSLPADKRDGCECTSMEMLNQPQAPAVKVVKRIVNGQLVIEINGIEYNAQGARIE